MRKSKSRFTVLLKINISEDFDKTLHMSPVAVCSRECKLFPLLLAGDWKLWFFYVASAIVRNVPFPNCVLPRCQTSISFLTNLLKLHMSQVSLRYWKNCKLMLKNSIFPRIWWNVSCEFNQASSRDSKAFSFLLSLEVTPLNESSISRWPFYTLVKSVF